MPAFFAEFHAFSLHHAVVIAVCALVVIGLCLLGRWAGTRAELRLRRAWIAVLIAWQAWMLVWWLLPANFEPQDSYPLHLCDLAVWLAPVALLSERRWSRGLLYFWAIGLSTQAFATPVLSEGAGEWRYWSFWIGHTQIVGSAVYDIVVRRFRPHAGDLGFAVGVGAAYAAAMFAFNVRTGFNYGYVGPSSPGPRTVLDALGPWPLRAVWVVLLATLAQVLAWLPWAAARGAAAGQVGAGGVR
ncbi:MAG: TIGR02206 family membrane protein [Planctomycetota bacterium]